MAVFTHPGYHHNNGGYGDAQMYYTDGGTCTSTTSSTSDDDVHFEGHIDLNFDPVLSETEIIRKKLEEILTKEYYINHVIIQFECGSCDNTDFVYESH